MSLVPSEMEMRVANIAGCLWDLRDIRPVGQNAFVLMAAEIRRDPTPPVVLDAIAAELQDPFYDDHREIFRQYMESTVLYLDLEDYSFTNALSRLGSQMPSAI
jgi:hypothetical protein